MARTLKMTRLALVNLVFASVLLGTFLSPIVFGGFRGTGLMGPGGSLGSEGGLSESMQRAAISLQQSYMNVYKQASPSVVYIRTKNVVRRGYWLQYDRVLEGAGSGFVVDNEGYIVTNSHVVAGARNIEVEFHDSRVVSAELIGRDETSDIALIQVKPRKDIQPIAFGDSDKVEPGMLAFAIGAPFGLNRTFTVGTISAVERQLDDSAFSRLQTDAAINPGNSGGPLLDVMGRVIGINQSIISPTGGQAGAGSVGIGFAIPINEAKKVVDLLKKERRVIKRKRPVIGVRVGTAGPTLREELQVGPEVPGVILLEIIKDSPAAKAGLRARDFVTHVDGKEVKTVRGFVKSIQRAGVGAGVKLDLIRDGKKMSITVKVGEYSPPN